MDIQDQQSVKSSQTPQEPRTNPIRVVEPVSKRGGRFLIAFFLFSTFVFLAFAVFFWVRSSSGEDQIIDLEDTVTQLEGTIADYQDEVFFYTAYPDSPGAQTQVRMVKIKSGDDEVLIEGYVLYAVPQIDYDGRIFVINSVGEGDNPSRIIYEVDVESGDMQKVVFDRELPFVFSATELSPDQTRLVAAYDNVLDQNAEIAKISNELVVLSLLDGSAEVITTLDEGQYFSHFNGENTFAGVSEYSFQWFNLDCVNTRIYKDSEEDPGSIEKEFHRTEGFCTE